LKHDVGDDAIAEHDEDRGAEELGEEWGHDDQVKGLAALHVLINQNRVSIWISDHEAGRASRAFICFYDHAYAVSFELALQLSNVSEFSELLSVATPARIEGENVLVEHALEQPNGVVAVLHDQPILRLISRENSKTQLLVKELGHLDVFYSQAH
jgi:hypothetical protein